MELTIFSRAELSAAGALIAYVLGEQVGVTVFGVLLFAYLLKVPFPIFRDDILSWSNWFGWVPL